MEEPGYKRAGLHYCNYFFVQVSLPVDMRPLPKEPEEKPKHKAHKMKKSKDHHEKPNISYPTKFTHVVHVGFDDDSGEFTGMPEAWTKLLVASNISKEMQMQNPQAVLDVLNYYEHSSKKTEDKYMTQTPSTDPSPRPSYSVSSHALSSPSSQSSQPVSGKKGLTLVQALRSRVGAKGYWRHFLKIRPHSCM